MPARRKAALTIIILLAALAVILAVAALVIVPRLADVDRYRPQVTARLEEGTARRVSIGRLSLVVLPALSLRADNVAIGNPPDFPEGRFLEIRHVYAELDPRALLRHEIVIRSLKFEEPVLILISNREGRWNSERPARVQPPSAATRSIAFVSGTPDSRSISSVQLEHGRLTAASLLPSGEVAPPFFEADGISAEIKDVNPTVLGLGLAPARIRPINEAQFGPAEGYDGRRAFLMKTAWHDAPVGQAAPLHQGPLAAHGTFSVESARGGNLQATAIKSNFQIYANGVALDGLAFELWGGRVTGDLIWNIGSELPANGATHLALAGIDVARLLLAFPSARGKLTGTLVGHFDLTGSAASGSTEPSINPLMNLEGTGEVTIRNGALPAIQLNRDLMALMKNIVRTGPSSPDPSSFSSISADVEIGGGEIHSRQITILGNGLDLTASGSLALVGDGQLNYSGEGKITARQNDVGNLVAALLGSKMTPGGKIEFPFTLTGTLRAPHFSMPRSPLLR